MNDQLDSPDTVETLERVEPRPAPSRPGTPTANFKPAGTSPQQQQPPQPVRRRTAFDDNDEDDQDDSFLGRHKAKLGITAVLLVGGLLFYLVSHKGDSSPRKAPERMVTITVPPPPKVELPPPPPKVEPPPKEEKKEMIEQPPVDTPEPVKPADEPPPLATGIKGDGGPSSWGLGSKGSGTGNGSSIGGRGGGPFAGFARSTASRLRSVISSNKKTRSARIPSCELRIWLDSTGRVTRVKVSTGDSAMDATLQGDVLPGAQLDPPPPGMPMPIVMRLSAQRPN